MYSFTVSSPLQTAEEAKQFLLACRDQSKREWAMNDDGAWATNGEARPALASNSVDYDSFLMTQRKRQQELKLRRKEAEQLLHGFRGSYGETFGTWSPRKNKSGRSSFGYSTTSDSLMDPDHSSSRRQSSMPRLEQNWDYEEEGRDDNDQFGERVPPSPLGSHRKDFLYDSRHYDGTEYPRTSQEMEVANGVSLFTSDGNEEREGDYYYEGQFDVRERPTQQSIHPVDSDDDLLDEILEDHHDQEYVTTQYPKATTTTTHQEDVGSILDDHHDQEYATTQYPKATTTTTHQEDVGSILDDHHDQEYITTQYPKATTTTTHQEDVGSILDDHHDQEYVTTQYPKATTTTHQEDVGASKGIVLLDDYHGVYDNKPEQREPIISSSSPYKARSLNLEIRTERENQIDITASEERLRQAGSNGGSAHGSDDDNEARSNGGSAHGRDDDDNEFDNGSLSRELEHANNRQAFLNEVSDEVRDDPVLYPVVGPTEEAVVESHDHEEDKRLSFTYNALPKIPSVLPEEVVYHGKEAPIPETVWRDFISSEPGAKYPPEAGRYHLYASYACPGSHRALIVRALKGLEDIISVTIVHPTWRHTNPSKPSDKHRGWIFGDPDGKPFHNTMGRGGPFPPAYTGNNPDPVINAYSVRNLYEYADDTSGKYTIPLLWDTKHNTIVNNESSDISYMLNSSFNEFAQNTDLDLYTEDDEDGLDRLNEVSQWLYPMMIHGVYRCGFAKTQGAYDQAIEELTEAFDAADELLQHQRYLTGDTLTDADIRLFVTLLRFDEVYAFYFRANTRLVMMTPALLNFCREVYQMPGVAETCQMDQIKAHFFGSHAEWNKYSVVPRGLGFMRYLDMPHDREKLEDFGHI
jgi:putative glutathione S-transferase